MLSARTPTALASAVATSFSLVWAPGRSSHLPDAKRTLPFSVMTMPRASSLTLAAVGKNGFSIAMIPYTRTNTNFCDIKAGQFVNLETDMIGKYVARFLKKK